MRKSAELTERDTRTWIRRMNGRRTVGRWTAVVVYPCHVIVRENGIAGRNLRVRCPLHGVAHPGEIKVRHEYVAESDAS